VVNDIYKSIHDFTSKDTAEKPLQKQFTMPKLDVDWRKNYLWTVFWKRVVASVLDGFIIGTPLILIYSLAVVPHVWNQYNEDVRNYNINYSYGFYGQPPSIMSVWIQLFFYYLLLVAIQIVIYAFMESSSWQGTLGKLIMKLQITDNAGNPISFWKSVVRNVIKCLIYAFASYLAYAYQSVGTIVFILFVIAQIISYTITKKFFHDQLSNTVIGERLK
jgi:uncharacterized RDD family membrane protein YckC